MNSTFYRHIISLVVSIVIITISYCALIKTDFVKSNVKIEIELSSEQESEFQFMIENDSSFNVENIQTVHVPKTKNAKIEFAIPTLTNPGKLRIDPSYTIGKWELKKITLNGLDKSVEFTGQQIISKFNPICDIKKYSLLDNKNVFVESNGSDSKFISSFYYKQYESYLNQTPKIYFLPLLLSICIGILVHYLVLTRTDKITSSKLDVNSYFIFVFIIIISTPFIWMELFPQNKISESENRILKSKPVFEFPTILSYPKKYTEYLEDNFGFKKEYCSLNSLYKLKVYNTSSKPDLVNIGKENWFFSVDPINTGDYQNIKLYSNDELNTIKNNIEEIEKWHEKNGTHFFMMILPIKSSIYPEHLSSNMKRKNETSKLNQLAAFLKHTNLHFIDVTDELLKAKKTTNVYFKHDIHWNDEGSYIGYTKLINEMSKLNTELKPTSLENYTKIKINKSNADLIKQLSLEKIMSSSEDEYKRITKQKFDELQPPQYQSTSLKQKTRRTIIRKSTLPKVVVYRDSFFNLMITYFSDNFSDCIYLWTDKMSHEVFEKEKPNFVVYEMLESDIDKLLEENPDWIKTK